MVRLLGSSMFVLALLSWVFGTLLLVPTAGFPEKDGKLFVYDPFVQNIQSSLEFYAAFGGSSVSKSVSEDGVWPLCSPSVWVLFMYANWCPHCHHDGPTFHAIASEYRDKPHVHFLSIDCQGSMDLNQVCDYFSIQSYPSVLTVFYRAPVDLHGTHLNYHETEVPSTYAAAGNNVSKIHQGKIPYFTIPPDVQKAISNQQVVSAGSKCNLFFNFVPFTSRKVDTFPSWLADHTPFHPHLVLLPPKVTNAAPLLTSPLPAGIRGQDLEIPHLTTRSTNRNRWTLSSQLEDPSGKLYDSALGLVYIMRNWLAAKPLPIHPAKPIDVVFGYVPRGQVKALLGLLELCRYVMPGIELKKSLYEASVFLETRLNYKNSPNYQTRPQHTNETSPDETFREGEVYRGGPGSLLRESNIEKEESNIPSGLSLHHWQSFLDQWILSPIFGDPLDESYVATNITSPPATKDDGLNSTSHPAAGGMALNTRLSRTPSFGVIPTFVQCSTLLCSVWTLFHFLVIGADQIFTQLYAHKGDVLCVWTSRVAVTRMFMETMESGEAVEEDLLRLPLVYGNIMTLDKTGTGRYNVQSSFKSLGCAYSSEAVMEGLVNTVQWLFRCEECKIHFLEGIKNCSFKRCVYVHGYPDSMVSNGIIGGGQKGEEKEELKKLRGSTGRHWFYIRNSTDVLDVNTLTKSAAMTAGPQPRGFNRVDNAGPVTIAYWVLLNNAAMETEKSSYSGLVMWLWRTHNAVTVRTAVESSARAVELQRSVDEPQQRGRVKVVRRLQLPVVMYFVGTDPRWPTKLQCAQCRGIRSYRKEVNDDPFEFNDFKNLGEKAITVVGQVKANDSRQDGSDDPRVDHTFGEGPGFNEFHITHELIERYLNHELVDSFDVAYDVVRGFNLTEVYDLVRRQYWISPQWTIATSLSVTTVPCHRCVGKCIIGGKVEKKGIRAAEEKKSGEEAGEEGIFQVDETEVGTKTESGTKGVVDETMTGERDKIDSFCHRHGVQLIGTGNYLDQKKLVPPQLGTNGVGGLFIKVDVGGSQDVLNRFGYDIPLEQGLKYHRERSTGYYSSRGEQRQKYKGAIGVGAFKTDWWDSNAVAWRVMSLLSVFIGIGAAVVWWLRSLKYRRVGEEQTVGEGGGYSENGGKRWITTGEGDRKSVV